MFHLELLVPWIAALPAPIEPAVVDRPFASLSDSIPAQDSAPGGYPQSDWFARLSAGVMTTDDSQGPGNEKVEFDEGFLFGAALGQRVTSGRGPVNADVDIEGLWTQQDASTTGALQAVEEITVVAALLNVTLHVDLAERISVYLGGGAGPAWMDVGTSGGFSDDDGPFLAWQARTGVEWRFAPRAAATLGYRFLNIDDANIDDGAGSASFDLETQQHALEAGLRFGL